MSRRATTGPAPGAAKPTPGARVQGRPSGAGAVRDLLMGARFALSGGAEGWVRLGLTALGVGLGVALLLLAASVPHALEGRDQRERARSDQSLPVRAAGPGTLLIAPVDDAFRGTAVRGRLLRPEGPKAPLPPGLRALPGPGQMYVSPALRTLLASGEGALLRERLPYTIVGTVDPAALAGPRDLDYWAGSGTLRPHDASRIDHFGQRGPGAAWGPPLVLLMIVMLTVLLTPVAVFVATAVRFGGERSDRRLAALRLVGADAPAVRRIAAGESATGALAGLLLGGALFLLARSFAARIAVAGMSFSASDITPAPALVLLIALLVPALAVLVTLVALRGAVLEPLGVVRRRADRPRRLWWRLLVPAAGLALLVPLAGPAGGLGFDRLQVAVAVVLLLVGVACLLPWFVQHAVARLHGGPSSWQLAVRGLQFHAATAVRPVVGIAVAVAGAIALGSLMAGADDTYVRETGADPHRAQYVVSRLESGLGYARRAERDLAAAKGVRDVLALDTLDAQVAGDESRFVNLTVADCASLREIASLRGCADGDAFRVGGDGTTGTEPGTRLVVGPSSTAATNPRWTLPADLPVVRSVKDPGGWRRDGVLLTPGAVPKRLAPLVGTGLYVRLDPGVPDAAEHLRVASLGKDPLLWVQKLDRHQVAENFATLEKGLAFGAGAVLLLTGASLLVSQIEQLRARGPLLATLTAFGTRRRTLALSLLWQTALPVVVGLALAVVTGLVLGGVLLRVARYGVAFDGGQIAMLTGFGAAMIAGITLLSLPLLWRLTRPSGLRTE